MQKIVELNMEEITAVTGGHKTVTASTSLSTAVVQPTLTTSTVNLANFTKPALALSTQSTLYRF